MTAATAPSRTRHPRTGPPLLGLAWLAWRQHRSALGWLLVPVAALVVGMILSRPYVLRDYLALVHDGCFAHPASSTCMDDHFGLRAHPSWPVVRAAALLPLLIGVYLGAPLVAREYEQGTHRFAWTQGIGPRRWVAGRALVLAAWVTAVTVPLALAAGWWLSPYQQTGLVSRWLPGGFGLGAPVYAAWTVFILCLGLLAGAVTRRTRPAMVTVLIAFAVLLKLMPGLLGSFLSVLPGAAPDSRFWLAQGIAAACLLAASALLVAAAAWLVSHRRA